MHKMDFSRRHRFDFNHKAFNYPGGGQENFDFECRSSLAIGNKQSTMHSDRFALNMSVKAGLAFNENILMPDDKIDELLELAEPQSDCDPRALQELPFSIFEEAANRNSHPFSQQESLS